ncbi:MAG: Leucyl aminopeptidase [Frankiales bacterium]|nr:Leucyl aminopeptidase [Frankiales bacterium]
MPPARRKSASLPGSAPLPEVRVLATRPVAAAALALPVRPGDDAVEVAGTLPDAGPDVPAVLAAEKAKGEAGEVLSLPVTGGEALERLLLVGVGTASPKDLRKAGAALARKAKGVPALVVDVAALGLDGAATAALVEGLLLASYGFTVKPGAEPRVLQEVVLVGGDPVGVLQAVVVARSTAFARDLVNTPPRELSPDALAKAAVAACPDLDVRVRDEAALRAEGFGGIVGVGQGSSRPPRFVEVTHDGGGSRHVVLVGKGITFDTGGLSLKPNASMLDMKSDMGGAAAVLGAVRAAADLQLPVKVTALLAIAENMPSGEAQRPGDVITQYGGRTVEVLNTDAEGRLVLADALAYADRDLRADVVVDVATLTGAMPVALGKKIAGLFSTDDRLAAELEAASAESGERLWRLPLVEDYRRALDSPTADLRNIGDPRLKLQGGSITAALFLREFTGGRPWAHLDIAGPAMAGGDDEELVKGGTGYGVRLLTAWLQAVAAQPARRGRRKSA